MSAQIIELQLPAATLWPSTGRTYNPPLKRFPDLCHHLAKHVPRLKHRFAVSGGINKVDVHVASGWAGNPITRKSTSGVVVYYSDKVIQTQTRKQKALAISSGETELYAIVSGMSGGIGIQFVLSDYGIQADVHVHTGSNAAISVVSAIAVPAGLYVYRCVEGSLGGCVASLVGVVTGGSHSD